MIDTQGDHYTIQFLYVSNFPKSFKKELVRHNIMQFYFLNHTYGDFEKSCTNRFQTVLSNEFHLNAKNSQCHFRSMEETKVAQLQNVNT